MSEGTSSKVQPPDPSLLNIIERESLRWIFVGGKSGVGKTTCSCSLALLLDQVRESVLVISTDPAHNLSHTFGQKFTSQPTKVADSKSLYAMELDYTPVLNDFSASKNMDDWLKEVFSGLPGVEEALSCLEILRIIVDLTYSVIIFDTAPSSQTVHFLEFPALFQKLLDRAMAFKQKLESVISHMGLFFGLFDNLSAHFAMNRQVIDDTLETLKHVDKLLKDSDHTTFICVCMPDFPSIYEMEKLIQMLVKIGIQTDNIIVNQVLTKSICSLCTNRQKIQEKYLGQISDLYDDFHLVKLPLADKEIRGSTELNCLATMLIDPSNSQSLVT